MQGTIWAKLFLVDTGAFFIFVVAMIAMHLIRQEDAREDEPFTTGETVVAVGFCLTAMVLIVYAVVIVIGWIFGAW